MSLAAGTRLDSFEIVAPLGAGGMGEVYRARDATLKRDVAIKVLPEFWSRDPDRLHRFEVEAQAAAALTHPNIVSIFHVGRYDGSPYIVTELLHGETLRDRLRHGPMRLREVIEDRAEIARGLATAHDGGIVHRDLKPENIFITKDGRVKILDFGIGEAESDQVGHRRRSHRYTATSDQPRARTRYSWLHVSRTGAGTGCRCTQRHLCSRGDPVRDADRETSFPQGSSAETMTAILNEDPPAVSQVSPSVPPGLQRIVNRCLAKNPEQRFQHASDLAFALESLSDSSGSSLTTVNQTVPSKRRTWIAAAAVVAIAIVVALILWWRQPPAVPVVQAVTQLTDDGEAKRAHANLLTDGSRIYYNQGTAFSMKIAQVAVTGGPTAIIPTRFALPNIAGLTHEGSALLAFVGPFSERPLPVWTTPLPTGEPRRLGSLEAQNGSFASDGRILFSQEKDLYIADKDGSNPRKLVSADGQIWQPRFSRQQAPGIHGLFVTV
jgi:hypothetical protein